MFYFALTDPNFRIRGGEDSETIPYQVSLQKGSHCEDKSSWIPWSKSYSTAENHTHTCSGAIIGNSFILTAAHCVYDKSDTYSVVVGISNLNSATDEHRYCVMSKAVHENYDNTTKANDIAVLKLTRPIDLSVGTIAKKIPFSSNHVGLNVAADFAG